MSLFVTICSSYDPTVIMPYREIPSSDIDKIGNSLQCSDPYANIKACAEGCFKKSSQGLNCVGFLNDGNGCKLCKVLSRDEVNGNSYTIVNNSETLYLLKSPKIEADIYISMEDIDLNTNTITGKGVSGGLHSISANEIVTGKKGQAIHFHGGRHIYTSVPQPDCYCSFDYCNGTSTLSYWTRSYSTGYQEVFTSQLPIGLSVTHSGGRYFSNF